MANVTNFKKITVTVTTAGTAVQVSADTIYVTDFELNVPSSNAGSVYIGDSTVDNTWIERTKAAANTNFTSGTGRDNDRQDDAFDLSKVYIDAANNGDTAIIQYKERVAF